MSYLLFTHPQLVNPFKRELDLARATDPAVRGSANPACAWIESKPIASKLLFKALSKTASPRPVANPNGPVNLWLAPSPLGATHHVGIVFEIDAKGQVQCLASNAVVKPYKGADAGNPKLPFEAFAKARSTTEKIKVLPDVVSRALTDQTEQVEKIIAEGFRYRTLVVFLVVLTSDKPLTFVTTLVITGPQPQARPELAFTAMVKP